MQLGRITEMAKQHHIVRSKNKRQEPVMCEIQFSFCEVNLEVCCPLCTQPSDPQGHHMWSIEEATSRHKKKHGSFRGSPKRQVVDIQKLVAIQDRKILEGRNRVETQM